MVLKHHKGDEDMNAKSMVGVFGVMVMAVFLTGCASTRISGEWDNPEVKTAGPYKKLFLTAVTGEEIVRRQLEDAFQVTLATHQVEGIQSYHSMPDSGKPEKEALVSAVKASGADGALVVRMVKKENKVTVTPTYYGPSGYYGGYYHSWDSFYAPATVYQYDVVTLEARLYDLATETLVMAISTETTDPGKLQKEIAEYSAIICERLAEKGALPVATK